MRGGWLRVREEGESARVGERGGVRGRENQTSSQSNTKSATRLTKRRASRTNNKQMQQINKKNKTNFWLDLLITAAFCNNK